jgi:hypothetical protein
MVARRALVPFMTVILASWVSSAIALDRTGAIDAAKRQVKDRCTTETPCTFDAKAQEGNWHVRVQFMKRNSPRDAHAIFIINQSGKVIGRMEE